MPTDPTPTRPPWWKPTLCDAAYFARLREDYPDDAAGKGDEELHEEYNESRKYSVTWDHVGDAYGQFEPLADAYLALDAENRALKLKRDALIVSLQSMTTEANRAGLAEEALKVALAKSVCGTCKGEKVERFVMKDVGGPLEVECATCAGTGHAQAATGRGGE